MNKLLSIGFATGIIGFTGCQDPNPIDTTDYTDVDPTVCVDQALAFLADPYETVCGMNSTDSDYDREACAAASVAVRDELRAARDEMTEMTVLAAEGNYSTDVLMKQGIDQHAMWANTSPLSDDAEVSEELLIDCKINDFGGNRVVSVTAYPNGFDPEWPIDRLSFGFSSEDYEAVSHFIDGSSTDRFFLSSILASTAKDYIDVFTKAVEDTADVVISDGDQVVLQDGTVTGTAFVR